MAGAVRLDLNWPRKTLQFPGWCESVDRHTLHPFGHENAGEQLEALDNPPDFLFQMPIEGCWMLKPTIWHPDFADNATKRSAATFGLTEFEGSSNFKQDAKGTLLKAKKILDPVASSVGAFDDAPTDAGMIWGLRTLVPLSHNEGWSIRVKPSGTLGDATSKYMGIGWGGKFYLELDCEGSARLYHNDGNDATPDWRRLGQLRWRPGGGGDNSSTPYSITCIPFGAEHLAFLVSEWSLTRYNSAKGYNYQYRAWMRDQVTAYIVRLKSQWDIECPKDIVDGVPRKTEPGPLMVAFQEQDVQYTCSIRRVIYDESLFPYLSQGKTYWNRWQVPYTVSSVEPSMEVIGYEPNGTEVFGILTNDHGIVWTPATDTVACPAVQYNITAGSGPHSPELWGLTLKRDRVIHTPSFTSRDVSDEWQMVRFTRTTAPEATRATFKYVLPPARHAEIMNTIGPLRLVMEGSDGVDYPVWEGLTTQRKPTVEGPKAITIDQLTAGDMFMLLNETPCEVEQINGKTHYDVLLQLLEAAGFDSTTDIDVETATATILQELAFSGWDDGGGGSAGPDRGASVGDFIRSYVERFSIQDRPYLRVRWRGDKWRVEFSPTVPSSPDLLFYHDDRMLRDGSLTEAFSDRAEATRKQDGELAALSSFEFTIEPPAFNELTVIGSARSGEGESALGAFYYDDRAVTDPLYEWFIGRRRRALLQPPEVVEASQHDINRLGRVRWEQAHANRRLCAVRAEYDPAVIDVDKFVMLVGRDPDGNQCSYGMWRIDAFDAEVTYDPTYSWSADYRLVKVSDYGTTDYPYFDP